MIFCPTPTATFIVQRASLLEGACASMLGVVLWSVAQSVAAQGSPSQGSPSLEDPFQLRLGREITWDANVFRIPDSAPDPQAGRGIPGRSDQLTRTSVGLKFDKEYGLQRLLIDIGQSTLRYDKFSSLNSDAYDRLARLNWQLGPRLRGTLSAIRSQSAVGFDQTGGTTNIVRTNGSEQLTVDGWLSGGWHLLAGYSASDVTNSVPFVTQPNVNQSTAEAGLRYVAESANSVSYTQRWGRGSYAGQAVNFVTLTDSGFTLRESELMASWVTGGQSALEGRLTWIERRYDNIPQRGFSGVAGEVRYHWTPTGNLTFDFSALQNLTAYTPDLQSSYRKDDTLSFAATWAVGATTTLRMNLSRQSSSFLGPVTPVAGPQRHDVLNIARLAVEWKPHARITLGASVQRQQRTSNDANFAFNDTIGGLSAMLTY